MGTEGEEPPKCFPHLYVDGMSAFPPELKCLVWIDFPARILVCWDMQQTRLRVPALPLASCGILGRPLPLTESEFRCSRPVRQGTGLGAPRLDRLHEAPLN